MTFFIDAITSAGWLKTSLASASIGGNQLRFETLLFGVGNELRAGERFGITSA